MVGGVVFMVLLVAFLELLPAAAGAWVVGSGLGPAGDLSTIPHLVGPGESTGGEAVYVRPAGDDLRDLTAECRRRYLEWDWVFHLRSRFLLIFHPRFEQIWQVSDVWPWHLPIIIFGFFP